MELSDDEFSCVHCELYFLVVVSGFSEWRWGVVWGVDAELKLSKSRFSKY